MWFESAFDGEAVLCEMPGTQSAVHIWYPLLAVHVFHPLAEPFLLSEREPVEKLCLLPSRIFQSYCKKQ